MRSPILPIAGLALAGVLVAPAGVASASTATQDSFQPAGNLVQARDGAQATLLTDGAVLVTGGNICTSWDGSDCRVLASAELFDPKTNQFISVGAMGSPRDDSHKAVLLKDGRVLIVGGSPDYQTEVQEAEFYDPPTRSFTAAGRMIEARARPTATLMQDGRVLVAGGWNTSDEHGPTLTAELFDPSSGKFQATGKMSVRRYGHSAVALPDGRVVILGGTGADGQVVSSIELYDPKSGAFSAGGNLVEARSAMTASLLGDDRVLVAGGAYADSNGNPATRSSVEIYDPATGQSTITDALADARSSHVAAPLAGGQILVTGGTLWSANGQSPVRTSVLVDAKTGKVSPTASLTVPRAYTSGAALLDGRVLVLGGDGADGSSLATAEVFVPGSTAPRPVP